jgi:predicted DNA-binding protein
MLKMPTSFRLSQEAVDILRRRAKELGVTVSAVVEMAIRKFGEDAGRPRSRGTGTKG